MFIMRIRPESMIKRPTNSLTHNRNPCIFPIISIDLLDGYYGFPNSRYDLSLIDLEAVTTIPKLVPNLDEGVRVRRPLFLAEQR